MEPVAQALLPEAQTKQHPNAKYDRMEIYGRINEYLALNPTMTQKDVFARVAIEHNTSWKAIQQVYYKAKKQLKKAQQVSFATPENILDELHKATQLITKLRDELFAQQALAEERGKRIQELEEEVRQLRPFTDNVAEALTELQRVLYEG